MPQFTRRTILAAVDFILVKTHAEIDRFALEYGLEGVVVGYSRLTKLTHSDGIFSGIQKPQLTRGRILRMESHSPLWVRQCKLRSVAIPGNSLLRNSKRITRIYIAVWNGMALRSR